MANRPNWRRLREWREIKVLFGAAKKGAYLERYHRLGRFVEIHAGRRASTYGEEIVAEIGAEVGCSTTHLYIMRRFYKLYPRMSDVRRFQAGGWPWRALQKLLYVEDARKRARLLEGWERGDYKDSPTFFLALQLSKNQPAPLRRTVAMTLHRIVKDTDKVIACASKSAFQLHMQDDYREKAASLIDMAELQLKRLRAKLRAPSRRRRRAG